MYFFLYMYWVSVVAQLVKKLPAMQETWVWSLSREDPLEEGIATRSSVLTWKIIMDRGPWQVIVHSIAKSRTRLSDWSDLNMSCWALRTTRKEKKMCYLAGISLESLPTVSPKEAQDGKNTVYWPQITEMHVKGMISVSPDSCIFSFIQKH